jgi:hypothetical protein
MSDYAAKRMRMAALSRPPAAVSSPQESETQPAKAVSSCCLIRRGSIWRL